MSEFNLQQELKKLPDSPGVYIMKDKTGGIIYVGKAVVLKNRVRQYFHSNPQHTDKVRSMVSNIREFEYIVTKSEYEALILECNLIKKYRPRYNVLMKDDKSYPFIKITMNEQFPRVMLSRGQKEDGSKYFGPYISAYKVRETIDMLKRVFPFKQCALDVPVKRENWRPCLNKHLGLCVGPCAGDVNRGDYLAVINDIVRFLEGRSEAVIADLQSMMGEASAKMEFEKAAVIRDRINTIRSLFEKQTVVGDLRENMDAIAVASGAPDSCVQIFFIRQGKMLGRENFIMASDGADAKEVLESFITQYYAMASYIPPLVLVGAEPGDTDLLQKWLSDKAGSSVKVRMPQRGDKADLMEMVRDNARMGLEKHSIETVSRTEIADKCLIRLSALLGMDVVPDRIEAYDISNTGTSERVASMIVYTKGLPDKSQYRRFKLRQLSAPDDYAGLREALTRRLSDTEGKYQAMPDLILADGGKAHVAVAKQVLDELGLDIPAAGMQKDKKHRSSALVREDGEIFGLTDDLLMLRFITGVQNEAHRFAIEYNKLLRGKRYSKTGLDDIPGIGPKKRLALYKHFGSLPKIKDATPEQLAAAEGIGAKDAAAVYDHFHKT